MALAIFDLDNTLIAGDSDHGWGEFLVSKNRLDSAHYRAMNDRFYADYEAGCLDIHAYLKFSLAPLAAIASAELAELHQEFMHTVIAPMRLEKATQLVEKHRQAGDQLLIITSTNRFIVEPICQSLGIQDILATDPEMIEGRYTGEVVGTPTYKDGKVVRYNQWLAENGGQPARSYFYTDSINDLPLLLQVSDPIAVDPDPALQDEAAKRGWSVISLRD